MAYTTINKPIDYFNTKLYTGNGAAARSITGVGFQPDWVWVKDRSVGYPHITWDSVRTNKASLCTNTADAEVTTTARTLTSFDSDGFTTPNVTGDIFNDNGTSFVSWNWKANGAGSSNTDGSTTSTVSANTTAGFSIVKWTGTGANATIGHGLSAVPKMIIAKRLSNTEDWTIYHTSLGATKKIDLNNNGAVSTVPNIWNNTAPISSVFYVGDHGRVNASGDTYIAYCFAEKTGYSKFGSYTGNGNADGTFVYTGFKPAFVIVKMYNSSANGNWTMHDNKRSSSGGFNHVDKTLYPHLTNGEDTGLGRGMDLLSNGFKFTGNDEGNTNGEPYIYMAFAEAPLVGSNNIPATAR